MAYVYLMESIRDYETIYKIGYSNHPKIRRNSIQTGNDGKVNIIYQYETNIGMKLEKAVQNFYSHKHKNMEWFDLELKDVLNFIPLCEKIEKNLLLLENNFI